MQRSPEQIANIARSKIPGGKILSVQLSDKHNPHFARILIRNFQNKRIAVIAEIIGESAENLVTTSLLWFRKLQKIKSRRAEKIWIASGQAFKVAKLRAALREDWQKKIRVFDRNFDEKFDEIPETSGVNRSRRPKIDDRLLRIISLSPENIRDRGRYLTLNGLPFVKFTGNRIWFGIENQTRLLTETNMGELLRMIEDLKHFRRFDGPNKSHLFYKLFPESWIESSLRNDISALDANLILSPLHQQFRSSSGQIDLLALRKDGRLVIIELKVSPNREHLFQAVAYWGEIEKQRTAGHLKGLFGELEIADSPSLVYLVAPHSCFHNDFDFLAKTVSKEIEIYRFDLRENWREKIEVVGRQKI